MAKKRVENGKKIDTFQVWTDSGYVALDFYLVRRDGIKPLFVAVCDIVNVEMEGLDLDALTTTAKATVKERSTIKWERHLYVRSSGRELDMARADHSDSVCDLSITIEIFDLATHNGKKIHRKSKGFFNGSPGVVRDEWPVERKADAEWGSAALIPDTEENRAVLLAFNDSLKKARETLKKLLEPENIASTFLRISSGSSALLGSGIPLLPDTSKE